MLEERKQRGTLIFTNRTLIKKDGLFELRFSDRKTYDRTGSALVEATIQLTSGSRTLCVPVDEGTESLRLVCD